MAGIYFHIPFCRQSCHYCNFHFSTSLKQKDEMVAAMQKEVHLAHVNDSDAGTIYFGGGTPSLLDIEDIQKLLSAVHENFNVSDNAEITLEANPDDITESKLAAWKSAGINRFSLGVQSFKNDDLQWMNRAHNAHQAIESIILIKNAGFDNFSGDLIYGTPALTDDDWKKNVEQMIDLNVPHISCYALTVETATPLQKMIALKKQKPIDLDKQASQFLLLMDWLEAAGYEHYEISNFAKPGYRSKHNSSYWRGKPYLGIGPSAHTFMGNKRRWNVSNNAFYIQSIKKDIIPYEEEVLTEVQKLNEYIMTAIRTIEGIDLNYVKEFFGEEANQKLLLSSDKYVNSHQLQRSPPHKQTNHFMLSLTREGKLFADGIAADLFVD